MDSVFPFGQRLKDSDCRRFGIPQNIICSGRLLTCVQGRQPLPISRKPGDRSQAYPFRSIFPMPLRLIFCRTGRMPGRKARGLRNGGQYKKPLRIWNRSGFCDLEPEDCKSAGTKGDDYSFTGFKPKIAPLQLPLSEPVVTVMVISALALTSTV